MNSLLDFPCCFIASSTRTTSSGGNEKVMVFVVRGMVTSLPSLTQVLGHPRGRVNCLGAAGS